MTTKNENSWRRKLACAYFFVAPALMYGVFTSRMPALKAQIAADAEQIGYLLLALGCSTLAGLLASGFLISRFGSRLVTAIACPWFILAMCCAASTSTWQAMSAFCILAGIGVGFCDVGMNALGISLEKRTNTLCLAFLHGCSGVGGVVGSLSGSAFAAFEISTFINLTVVLGLFLIAWPLAFNNVDQDYTEKAHISPTYGLRHIAAFVWFCGALSLLCHIVEGTAGEWGSLLLHSVKGATEQQAALVFAFFTGALVLARFCTDPLRLRVSDFSIVFAGSILGAVGMSVALISPWPMICLFGYAIMGAGVAPIVPILFSRAGATPGISAAQASSVVSVFSYAGLLLFPPLLGILAHHYGLTATLWLITGLCILMAICSFPLSKTRSQA